MDINVEIPAEKLQENIPEKKQKSRFKVDKVEFKELPAKDEVEKEENGTCETNDIQCKQNTKDTDKTENKVVMVCGDSIGSSPPMTPNHTDSYQQPTYGETHMKTFGHNTLETLPHMDHYRNLLSATGAMKKRPTLLELHELEQVFF